MLHAQCALVSWIFRHAQREETTQIPRAWTRELREALGTRARSDW